MAEDTLAFSKEDLETLAEPYNALVISFLLNNIQVKRVLVDPGSSDNIIGSGVVEQLGLLDQIIPASRVLHIFTMTGEVTKGEITLPVNTSECQRALEELKRYLTSPPLLHMPKEDETLFLYLAVSEIAVSGVQVQEEQGLELAKSLGAETIKAKYDSLLVVNQVNGSYKVRENRMQRYLDKIQIALRRFKRMDFSPCTSRAE
uniref:Uncharacterized protein LOC104233083 n=1 Tax=Nicotiana sylvestris TaxID=4096 RepID=A0A1U7XCM1_NICSY|nr:PREDICTED: uncharacterized protein LOC104233083 [Nicotiana sylvestris]